MKHETLANKLRQMREDRDLTQRQVAAALSISNKTISKWETGKGIPDVFALKNLAAFYGCTIDEFLSDK